MSNSLFLAALAGFGASFATLLLFATVDRIRSALSSPRGPLSPAGGRLVFEGRYLVASDGPAKAAFDKCPAAGDDWDRAVSLLGGDYAGLDRSCPPVSLDPGELLSAGGEERISISRVDGLVTLAFSSRAPADAPLQTGPGDREAERETLRIMTNAVPVPIWIRDDNGRLTWVNASYLALAREAGADEAEATWPPPELFDDDALPDPSAGESNARLALLCANSRPACLFDITAVQAHGQTVFAAVCADAVVRAETRLREYTETFTKTFAHLTVGVALFDRGRRLVIFNPALSDLTGLSAEFLASKPTLAGVLDRLRERRVVPEPKDYAGWRRKLAELEAAATDGSYEETWSLPNGRTYRVTGRPHPDGAVIFLFEDISAEISLTRRYRSELEMGQAVIDSLDEAIAVFTADGVLAMTNSEYARLWGNDPRTELSGLSVGDVTASWLARTAPTPAWGDFRDFARQSQNRAEWAADVVMRDGRLLFCRFVPLAEGATLAGFRPRRTTDLRHRAEQRQTA